VTASPEDARDIVGRIYDAAFDPALWPEVLTLLADSLGGASVFKFDHDTRTNATGVIAPRHAPDYLRNLYDRWLGRDYEATGNVLAAASIRAPPARPLGLWNLVKRDEFVASDFYNEWWRPQALGLDGLFVKWTPQGGPWGFCCIHPLASHGDFDSRQSSLFALAAPHLVRAAVLQRRLWSIAMEHALVSAGLARPHIGVIVTDAAANVVVLNDAATQMVNARDGVLIEGSRLGAADAGVEAALGRLIAGCASPRLNGGAGGTIAIPRRRGPPLKVLVAPFRGFASETDRGERGLLPPGAILIFTDAERERESKLERLRERFGLTAAEARLALEIARGDGREAAAHRAGITLGTARTHLQRIFDKVGVHRQAELVSLVAEWTSAACPVGEEGQNRLALPTARMRPW
jgi:DNA-binding CsgD family transcriptional regulator